VTERPITIDCYNYPAGRWSLRHDYKRLARYGHARWDGQRLVVPVAMPSLSPTQLDRVPERIAREIGA
jgi:hypothetical protein